MEHGKLSGQKITGNYMKFVVIALVVVAITGCAKQQGPSLLEYANRFVAAFKHAIELCGGKPSAF